MSHQPNYEKMQSVSDIIDRLQIWLAHERQPLAYDEGADSLSELGQKLIELDND